MKKLEIEGKTGYSTILINESLSCLSKYLRDKRTVIITDQRVLELYGNTFPEVPVIEIGMGEKIKTLSTVDTIYQKLIDLGIDRHSFIVGIGGGIVCDITGFAASTFMRGIPFGFVSSTLLSQVDASVGGKNGVNFQGYKNMVGVFQQPQFVICDIEMLTTLSPQELSNGFAEIIKHTLISDKNLFIYMENNNKKIMGLDPIVMEELIHKSVSIKANIVRLDETEHGIRKILNFGHTFGHALEKTKGITHGEAVSIGMVMASRLSLQQGSITQDTFHQIINILKLYHLPTEIQIEKNQLLSALTKDKKKDGNHLDFVQLNSIGDVSIQKINIDDLGAVINDMPCVV